MLFSLEHNRLKMLIYDFGNISHKDFYNMFRAFPYDTCVILIKYYGQKHLKMERDLVAKYLLYCFMLVNLKCDKF